MAYGFNFLEVLGMYAFAAGVGVFLGWVAYRVKRRKEG